MYCVMNHDLNALWHAEIIVNNEIHTIIRPSYSVTMLIYTQKSLVKIFGPGDISIALQRINR